MDEGGTLDRGDRCAWVEMQDPAGSATRGGAGWFAGRVLPRAVNNQDVIKMSDGHQNVVIRYNIFLVV